MSAGRTGPRVFVLCLEERQAFYKPHCERWGDRVRFVDNIDDLFMEASDTPPQGVLVDIMTSVRMGANRFAAARTRTTTCVTRRARRHTEGARSP